jgi:thiamine-phosphate pyrophosphorylase
LIMQPALRMIDANYNRAREGLRTLEDVARFALDDASLTEAFKTLRHTLCETVEAVDPILRLASRDTPGDVGTSIKAKGELERASLADVAAAAGSRLTESLRALEEASKCVDARVASAIERIRYQAYTLEQRLRLQLAGGRAPQWRLCVLITERLCTHLTWHDVAAAAIKGGADCLQLREKELEGGELVRRAAALVALARPHGVSVIVNDRVDVALLAGAHGVHVGQSDLSVSQVRSLAGASLLVGVSTSNLEQATEAMRAGADYCGVGPMYPTTTKHKPSIAGPVYLAEYLSLAGRPPHLAIGGISIDEAAALGKAGAEGIAVSSCVCGSSDPEATCRSLRRALGR